MKAIMEVKRAGEVEQSQRTGKPYAVQPIGLRLPGDEYPIPRDVFIQMENGKPKFFEPGMYEVDLSVTDDRQRADVHLRINTRSATKVELKLSATKGAA